MHPMSENISQVSNLKILLKSNFKIGTAREAGCEVIPYTPYIAKLFSLPKLAPPGPIKIDEIYKKELRPYQIADIELLASRKCSANLSEPRTGKTPTALRLFKAKGVSTYIIVAPASSLYQWKSEVHRWTDDKAFVIAPNITLAQRLAALKDFGKSFNVLIISYDSLKLIHRGDKITGLLNQVLKLKLEGIIVDEAHRIRNHRSQQAKAIFALSKIEHKHVLTGTPAHGTLPDLYSILHFLYPKVFSGYWGFVNYYFNTYEMRLGTHNVRQISSLKNPHELPQLLERISVQHKRKDVMSWLPDKTIINVKLPVTEDQKRYIDELTRKFETDHVIVENVLTQLIRIRQVCADPRLLELKTKGLPPKLEWLKQYILDNPEKPIIIFSNLTSFLEICAEELKIPNMITGKVSSINKEKVKLAFQSGSINQLLINTQAGKEALTLDRAEVAIFLDTYPPYGDVDQAENRFTTTKQENAEKEHTIIRVMMEGTYDEELYKLVDQRATQTEIVNNFKKFLKGGG